MAQQGIAGTIISLSTAELGRISGAGGFIGAIIEGYAYYPLEDRADFEETIQMLVIDKNIP